MNKITLEQVRELHQFLQGVVPKEVQLANPPKLTPEKAFDVIWFLQEHLGVLPDNFEMCQVCHEIFDQHSEGWVLDDQYGLEGKTLPKKYWGIYCDICVPDVDFKLR